MNKREEKYMARTAELIAFDRQYSNALLAGIDEVGRGPLAGDVYAACVILPHSPSLLRIDDSKKISQKAREKIADDIKKIAIFCNVGIATVAEIDKYNILGATKLAMQRAAQGANADCFLIDAVHDIELQSPIHSIISGDSKSYAIAAASIIAKVARDRYMEEQALLYPEYSFEKNKGYGTKEHIAAIKEYGPCRIHRSLFIRNFI